MYVRTSRRGARAKRHVHVTLVLRTCRVYRKYSCARSLFASASNAFVLEKKGWCSSLIEFGNPPLQQCQADILIRTGSLTGYTESWRNKRD